MKRWLPIVAGGLLAVVFMVLQVPPKMVIVLCSAAMAVFSLVSAVQKPPARCRDARAWRRANLLMAIGAAAVAVTNQWSFDSQAVALGAAVLGGVGVVGGSLWLRKLCTVPSPHVRPQRDVE